MVERLKIRCVATSAASAELGGRLGLLVEPMEAVEAVDYLFDGADEVDPKLRMIKGRGGAMTREKIVVQASAHRVYFIQNDKLVRRLGEHLPLPLEVLRFGLAHIRRALRDLGLDGPLRLTDSGAVYETDNGNPVIDAVPVDIDPERLAPSTRSAGSSDTGCSSTRPDLVLSEDDTGKVTRLERTAASTSS